MGNMSTTASSSPSTAPGSAALLLACTHCSATNRLPAHRVDEAPSCGKCGQPLLQGQALALDDGNFDAVVRATRLPVLVDFWAPWCGPCRMMAPAFEQAARQLAGRALLVKVNSDDNPQLSSRFGIRSIPTLVRLQGGRETQRQSGALPLASIVALAGA
jgi:thioredoxin 2